MKVIRSEFDKVVSIYQTLVLLDGHSYISYC